MKEIGIYVHIPFCQKKCKYCDFISFENKTDYEEKYVESLKKTIEYSKNQEYEIDTIYFGGGTPSIIKSEHIVNILKTIRSNYKV